MIGWLETPIKDVTMEVAMDLMVAPSYVAWWIAMHLGPLGLDALDSRSDDVLSLPSKEDDHMHVDNPIHDDPPPVGGLEVVEVVSPLYVRRILLIMLHDF